MGTTMLFDKEGQLLKRGDGNTSQYKISDVKGTEHFAFYTRKRRTWTLVSEGALAELKALLPQPPSPVVAVVYPLAIQTIYERLSYLPHISLREVNSSVLVHVNRARCLGQRLINLRWPDRFGQPIYILDCSQPGFNPNTRYVYVVDSLAHARRVFPQLEETCLPAPLQWSKDFSDYMWNPDIEVVRVSEFSFDHIVHTHRDRLPAELQRLPDYQLFQGIQNSLRIGQECAMRDTNFAIPNYATKSNSIGKMLPLRINTEWGQVPEAALILRQQSDGYFLTTIFSLEQAYANARLFVDPENTWLRGALD